MDIGANILVDTIALTIAMVALLGEPREKRRALGYPRRFFALLTTVSLVLVADLTAWLCDGQSFPGARTLSILANTGYYAAQIAYCWLWALFVAGWDRHFKPLSRAAQIAFALPLLAEIAALIASLFSGSVFYMDAVNHYHRGEGYLYNLIPYVAYNVISLFILLRAWFQTDETARRRNCAVLLVAMLLPACGSLIEARHYGLTFTWPLATLALLLISLSARQEQNALDKAEAANVKAELTQIRMNIMLSQIQPHFLYNSLAVIAELCDTDPAKARYATVEFAAFLRGNMDSLSVNKPIYFEHELLHTRHYLALEQLRFQDRLRVTFDIEATDFTLPTLTLQPIVENAVRHGVTKRPEGGTVRIATRETPEGYAVIVSDDGVGFDPNIKKEDGRAHVGLQNVRDRLKRMVNGTLTITAEPGRGATVVMTIPKEALPC